MYIFPFESKNKCVLSVHLKLSMFFLCEKYNMLEVDVQDL